MIDHKPWSLRRRALLVGLAGLAASTATGGNQLMAAIEQNTLKRRGIGLRACDPERRRGVAYVFADERDRTVPGRTARRSDAGSRTRRAGN